MCSSRTEGASDLVVKVTCGSRHTALLTSSGRVIVL
jgi:alpha-tubulin suppressor-like RCC1 family protein